MVKSKQLTKDLTLYLLYKIIDSIAINECTFFGIVSMQVEVKRKSTILDEVIC